MDDFTQLHMELLAKISKLEINIEYFSGQVRETDILYKQGIKDNLPKHIMDDLLTAKKESETNLNLERKVLRALRTRLDSGDYNTSLSTPSSLGKRKIEE